jgi:glycosyltransferase involved in cell wall biosynthesis
VSRVQLRSPTVVDRVDEQAPLRVATVARPRVMLVGPGKRFLGGITYYTYMLAGALADQAQLSVMLMRRLVPRRLYPGRQRVGKTITASEIPEAVPVFDGVDYFWFPSILRALRFVRTQRPEVVLFQWWSSSVLHSYLAIAWMARRTGAQIVVEFHETLDPAEQQHRWLTAYVQRVAPRLFAQASAYVVHCEYDRKLVRERYGLADEQITVVPHALYDHYRRGASRRDAPPGVCNLLFFGLIRPVKGLEDLVDAFDHIPDDEIEHYWLTVVGETWEGWDVPIERIRSSRHRDRITLVNRYVTDEEVDAYFGGADAVVLPYRRASQSGVLHVAMAYGLPIVATNVGGLTEALVDYPPHVVADPDDSDALVQALRTVRTLQRDTSGNGPTWSSSAHQLRRLCDTMLRENNDALH